MLPYLDPRAHLEQAFVTPEYRAMFLENIDWGISREDQARRGRALRLEEEHEEEPERTGGEQGEVLLAE